MLSIRTGEQPVVHDLTRACAEFVQDHADGLLHVFVRTPRPGWRSWKPGREVTTTCWPSSTSSYRRIGAGGTATAAPGTAATT